jgi:UDP-N-acetylglucosamine--N-acetylmuramyl-(pentapeptide) pyrophosphoryl-undecaprenol N-acetylglucosamine transferase
MKIVITGAGGGHFYPLMAVIDRIQKESFIQKIIKPEVYFFSDQPYDEKALFENDVKFVEIPAGKLRLYASAEIFGDIFKTMYGCIVALFKLYALYPDVVFAKGGYASFPTLFAARMLSVPVVVHESDTVPGRTTKWAGKFALRVALSYPEAAIFFPTGKTALVGQPIMDKYLPPPNFKREETQRERTAIMILCGSQGSQMVNEMVLKILPTLLDKHDIIHQVGPKNFDTMKKITTELLKNHQYKDHYFSAGFLDLSLFYPKVDMVITRGSSAMFEVALWQLPMLVIPIPESISRDQRSNAYAMAGRGIATVVEENNIGNSTLLAEIDRILENKENYKKMSQAGQKFESSRGAANTIARELLRICLSHS